MDQETKQAFENLTSLVQEGFSKHDKEFVKVHQSLKKHDEEFKKHDDIFSKIHASLKKHDDLLKKHEEDIENLALMTQRGFNEAEEKNQAEHAKMNEKIDYLIKNTDAFLHIYQKVDVELTITQHNCQELDKRVTVLETAKT